MKKFEYRNLSAILLSALTVWCFYLVMAATGPQQDDFWYSRVYEEVAAGDPIENFAHFRSVGGEYLTSWSQALESCRNHYLYHDNARMANCLRLISNLAPEWAVDLASALFLALLVAGIVKAALPKQNITPGAWGASVLLAFLYPWWQHPMLSADFLMNYLWSTAMLLWAWIAITGNPRRRQLWYLAPFCFFAGTMHESLSAAMIAGLLLFLLMNRRTSGKIKWILFGAVAAGATFIIFSPALLSEALRRSAFERNYVRYLCSIISGDALTIALTAGALVGVGIRRGAADLRRLLKESLPLLAIVVTSYAICVLFSGNDRALWLSDIALAVITMRAIRLIWTPRALTSAAGWLVTLAVCGWLGLLSVWQVAATRNIENLLDTARESGDVIYFDLLSQDDFPFTAFNVVGGPFDINEIISALASVDGLESAKHKVVLPEKYRGVPFDSLPAVAGTANLRGDRHLYFYAPREHGDGVTILDISYGPPGSKTGANLRSSSPIARLIKKIRSSLSGIPDTYLDATLIPVVVSEDMKRQGLCDSDTAWFYGLHCTPEHYLSCKVEAIDIVKN